MLVEENIKLASDWLSNSEIFGETDGRPESRAVRGGYHLPESRYDCIYHEINGYAISCFVDLYRTTRNSEYLLHARSVAEYLLSTLSDDDGVGSVAFLHSISIPSGNAIRKYFAFDNGMIASGLLDLYEVTGDRRYFDAANACVNWVIDTLQMSDGAMHSYYDGDSGGIWHGGTRFDKDRSVLHAKITIPILKLWRYEKNEKLLASAHALLRWGMGLQDSDGAFWSNEHRKVVFTHSHCYAAEGFLYAYHITARPEYLDSAMKAARWLAGAQLGDGSLNYQYKNRQSILDALKDRLTKRKTTDATAQSVRLWLLADTVSASDENARHASRAVEFLKSMQCLESNDHNALGGLFYRRKESMKGHQRQEVLYSWCTHFAVQAFNWWRLHETRKLSPRHVERIF